MTNDEQRAIEEYLREMLPQAAKLAFGLRDFTTRLDIDPEPLFELMMRVMGSAVDAPPEVKELSVLNQAQAEAMFHVGRKAHLN